MGKKDSFTKILLSQNDVFADIFNFLLFDGKNIIPEDSLTEMDTCAVTFISDDFANTYPIQKSRDVLKNAIVKTDGSSSYVLFMGIESQSDVNYSMPVRNMLYDAICYSSQIANLSKENRRNGRLKTSSEYLSGITLRDKLKPVVTAVVYLGTDPWVGPLSLYEMIDAPVSFKEKYISNYKLNLVAPVMMSDHELTRFTSQFHEVAGLLQCGKDKNKLQNFFTTNRKLSELDLLTANVINELSAKKLYEFTKVKGRDKMIDYLQIFREIGEEDGIKKGIEKGIEKGKSSGRKEVMYDLVTDGLLDANLAADRLGISPDTFEKERREYLISKKLVF